MRTSFVKILATAAAVSVGEAGTAQHPCGRVGESFAAQAATGADTRVVDAALAYECLTSVPIVKDSALRFIDEIAPYLEWQSDTSYKKNPPQGYFYPGYDIWAELADIRAKIASDTYKTEYAWQSDLFLRIIGPGHDGHMYLYPDLLDSVHWQRNVSLVSVSEDGLKLPAIKVYEDVISGYENASVVTHIDGKNAVTYIEDWVNQVGEFQDRDANYNSMFFSTAQHAVLKSSGSYHGGGRTKYVYPGETTTLTFENGTVSEMRNSAMLIGDWSKVVNATTFLEKLCPNALPGSKEPEIGSGHERVSKRTDATRSVLHVADKTAWPGYPKAEIVSVDNSTSGYFLQGEGFEDVAVLALTSISVFASNAQATVQEFFQKAVHAGKKKLVVDLQVNGGGFIFLAYDIFRQIFPDIVQDSVGRMRLSAGLFAVANISADVCANWDPVAAEEAEDDDLVLLCQSPPNYGYELDQYLEHYQSFEQKFTPFGFNGDKFSNLSAWDLGNWVDSSSPYYGFNMNVTGYGNRKNFTRPFGGPENVVVLFDGACASACTVFSECMIHDAGVKTISFGGRPKSGLTQGVGGVKGTHVASYDDIRNFAGRATRKMTKDDPAISKELSRYTGYPISRTKGAAINLRDNIIPSQREAGIPSQFIDEYSDCRIFWTEGMIKSPEAIWKAAAGAAFNDQKCAAGGFSKADKRQATRPRKVVF